MKNAMEKYDLEDFEKNVMMEEMPIKPEKTKKIFGAVNNFVKNFVISK